MKECRKITWLLSFSFMVVACSTVEPVVSTNWIENNMVSVAWDPATMMKERSKSDKGEEIKYLVYINNLDKHKELLTEKYVNGILLDKKIPIAETVCTVRFSNKGKYAIGVQSVLLDADKQIKASSAISWSTNKRYTNNSPFAIRVKK